MSTISLNIDDRKLRSYIQLERKLTATLTAKQAAEESARKAQNDYGNCKAQVLTGGVPASALGTLHVVAFQAQAEAERLAGEVTKLQNDLNSIKHPMFEEVLAAARVVVQG